jgi:2-dehydropantoate 2-reductase
MKICVLGSGALGSTFGGLLTEAGFEVYLIDKWKEHVHAMNTEGLKIIEGSSERVVKVRATTDYAEAGPADLVIFLVKSFDTKETIEKAQALIGSQTMVLSFQNGLGNEEILAEVVGPERVIGGKTYVGGVLVGPGHVIAGTKGKYSYIGELDGTTTERVTAIADQFNRAGLLTNVSSDILAMIWDKLLINVATGALCAITRLPYGGLYKLPEVRDCAFEAISEGIAVAEAYGIELSCKNPEEIWLKAAEGLPDEFKPSMLQSVEKGAKTEIDFINGSVVKWGAKYNIPTPVNKALVASVKGIEYWIKNYAGKA